MKVRVAVYAGVLALGLLIGGGFYLAHAVAPGAPRDADLAASAVVPMSSVQRGYRLASDTMSFPVGVSQPFRFQILGPDGQPVRDLAPGQGPDLNLVVVRLDGAAFQHPLPVRDMTGTWTAPLTLPSGGSYAAWVSFTAPGGAGVVLGSYLSAAGDFQPQALPSPASSTDVDGYHVQLAGTPAVGTDSELTLSVSRDGTPVTDLQSTADTFAHLAVMRTGDLAYAFTDATPQLSPGREDASALRFSVRLPTSGTYWLFVQFLHLGQVHVATLTVTIPTPTPTPTAPSTTPTPMPAARPGTPGGH
ncbi:MAG: hypothetical protein M3Z25_05225 [Actinomycetota bacterium]|nr:hypothetical protein [Actinomycetota bacterium]